MLTGDKLETAENIGYSTNLISKTTKVFKIRANTAEGVKTKLTKIKKKIQHFRKGSSSSSLNPIAKVLKPY